MNSRHTENETPGNLEHTALTAVTSFVLCRKESFRNSLSEMTRMGKEEGEDWER